MLENIEDKVEYIVSSYEKDENKDQISYKTKNKTFVINYKGDQYKLLFKELADELNGEGDEKAFKIAEWVNPNYKKLR